MTNEEAKVQLKFLYNMEVDRGEYHIAKTIETAIDALERIDRITAERDAAISDLKYLPSTTCKYANTDYCTNDCLCDKYEWRGIQNETD